jgi:hypothetical protein
MNVQDQVLWLMKFMRKKFSGGILHDNKYCFDSTQKPETTFTEVVSLFTHYIY